MFYKLLYLIFIVSKITYASHTFYFFAQLSYMHP